MPPMMEIITAEQLMEYLGEFLVVTLSGFTFAVITYFVQDNARL